MTPWISRPRSFTSRTTYFGSASADSLEVEKNKDTYLSVPNKHRHLLPQIYVHPIDPRFVDRTMRKFLLILVHGESISTSSLSAADDFRMNISVSLLDGLRSISSTVIDVEDCAWLPGFEVSQPLHQDVEINCLW